MDTLLGIILILLGLGFITLVTFRSRSIIENISKKEEATLRELLNEMQDDTI